MITDEMTPRDKWKIARVDEILSQDKNHVRRVRLTTAEGKTYERHLNKIIPLELETEEEGKREKKPRKCTMNQRS